jgi:amidase
VDVFLSPVLFTPAFPHDRQPMDQRTIATPEGPAPYWNIFNWIAHPTLTGCPATAAPIGLTAGGLPADIQIMGPYWEDATPIRFASLLARKIGGFHPPAGFAN